MNKIAEEPTIALIPPRGQDGVRDKIRCETSFTDSCGDVSTLSIDENQLDALLYQEQMGLGKEREEEISAVLPATNADEDANTNADANTDANTNANSNENENANANEDTSVAIETEQEDHLPDPNAVDELLTQEVMRLSLQQRTNFQEEVHGVRCLAPEETPELYNEALDALQRELDALPASEKVAYLKSQSMRFPGGTRAGQPPGILHRTETYVNSREFRLRFLRCDLFDASKAALRVTKFLDLVYELFGEVALWRPIQLCDFSAADLRKMKKGRYQLLPYRDRGGAYGRRVIAILPDAEWEEMSGKVRSRIFVYLLWVAGNDVNAQKEGMTYVVWFDPTFRVNLSPTMYHKHVESLSIRISAFHMCTPNTEEYRIRRSTITKRMDQNGRFRLKQHMGGTDELRGILRSYGIPIEHLPITESGAIKLVYFRQWTRLRAWEEKQPGGDDGFGPRIESPYLNDVIFRKRFNTSDYPGNATFYGLVREKALLELQQSQKGRRYTKRATAKAFVLEVVRAQLKDEEVGRFLQWDEDGWWTELSSETEIIRRVEYTVTSVRNAVTKFYRNNQENNKKNKSSSSSSKAATGNATDGGESKATNAATNGTADPVATAGRKEIHRTAAKDYSGVYYTSKKPRAGLGSENDGLA